MLPEMVGGVHDVQHVSEFSEFPSWSKLSGSFFWSVGFDSEYRWRMFKKARLLKSLARKGGNQKLSALNGSTSGHVGGC